MRGILIVDKAKGPTSHDVVRLVRRAFGTRAVGHAGTLDPMASGVLVIGIGEGTKLLHHLSGVDKSYSATVQLGAQTDTLDAEGVVIARKPLAGELDLARVQLVAERFIGETLQRAPEISAIKQGGLPLYARVRRGETVVAPERNVRVRALRIEAVTDATIELEVACGKGFYVRSLARDLAEALDTLGHLSRLRRTASGAFGIDEAVSFDVLRAAADGNAEARATLRSRLLTLPAALRACPSVTATPEGADDIRHGRPLVAARIAAGELPAEGVEPIAVLDGAGDLLALGRAGVQQIAVLRGITPSQA